MPELVPVARLAFSVWEEVRANLDIGSLGPLSEMALRRRLDSDLECIFDAFEALGAVTSTYGLASDIFTSDLDMPDGPFGGEDAAVLRDLLAKPGRLVTLTPLCTRAMRQRLLAEGSEAGLVGELVSASAAELLGTVAEHYTPEEEAAWLIAGSVLQLLEVAGPDAVRESLEVMPRAQRKDVVRAVRDSGFPARGTLEEFGVVVADPILGAPSPGAPPRPHLRLVRNQPHRRAPRARRSRRLPASKMLTA